MTSTLAPIADKLGKLIRLLSSDKDGEVLAAVAGIRRTLAAEKLDLHALADSIDGKGSRSGGASGQAGHDRAWDAGYAAGRADAERTQAARHDEPSWYDIACECQARGERLRDHERQFVEDMVRRTVHGGTPTERQAQWLRALWARIRR